MACLDLSTLMVDMIYQLSNKYLLNSFMVYLGYHDAHLGEDGRNLQVEMIDQLSSKYLLNSFMVYLHQYDALPFELGDKGTGRNDWSVIKQVLAEII